MHPSITLLQERNRQQGSMLVMAIFVIVVLSLLGLTMVRMLSATSQSVVYEVLGARAVMAAESGLQHISTIALPVQGTAAVCNTTVNSPASYSNIEGLKSCRYSARCTTSQFTRAGVNYNYYRFSSSGVCQAGDIWVSRTVSMDANQERE